jgi:Putative Flp pilus-assembly TadE/G-like
MGRLPRGHTTHAITRAGMPLPPRHQWWSRWTGRQRGQSLVIFVLSVSVLMGLAGLAIDVMRVYDLYARAQRAAEAGALAGVLYMPCFYNVTTSVQPCSPGTSPLGLTAISRSLLEVRKNGFGAGVTPPTFCTDANTSAEVTVCQVSGRARALQVNINEPIEVFLLSAVSVNSFTVTAHGAAEFFDPYVLGSDPSSADKNVWGDGGIRNPKGFLAAINGPAELKEQGDPFVYCEEGPSVGPMPSPPYTVGPIGPGEDINSVAGTTTAPWSSANPSPPLFPLTNTGILTNHPQYATGPLCGTSNPDQQPGGFTGTQNATDAFNYAITTLGSSSTVTVWVFNPGFAPKDLASSCNGFQTFDMFFQDDSCSTYYTKYGTSSPLIYNGHFDDPRFYFDVTYSLYNVPSVYFRSSDTLLQSTTFHPQDQLSADLALHCPGGAAAYDLTETSSYTNSGLIVPGTGCQSSSYAYTWQQIGTITPGSTYRLAVEATGFDPKNGKNASCADPVCGWGRHGYALAVCSNGTTPMTGCTTRKAAIAPWNNMDIYMNFPSAINDIHIPLAYIPASFAGKTLTISLFNPETSHGNGGSLWFKITPPDPCVTVPYGVSGSPGSTWVTNRVVTYPGPSSPSNSGPCTAPTTGVFAAQANGGNQPADDIYNGLWISTTITLPTAYNCGSNNNCQWWLDQHTANGKDFNEFVVQMLFNGGSPEHLIL